MRTAIFVYEPTTVTITTKEADVALTRLDGATPVAFSPGKPVALDAGIYKVVSVAAVTVTGEPTALYVASTTNDKDPFPEPPPKPFTAAPITAIQGFFQIVGIRHVDGV